MKNLRTNLSDLKRNKLYDIRTNGISNLFLKNHWKSSTKYQEENQTAIFYASHILKNEFKPTVFLIWLQNSRLDFFRGQKNMQFCFQQFFQTQRDSLQVSIIRTDTLRITSFTFQIKIWQKDQKILGKKMFNGKVLKGRCYFLVNKLKLSH